MEIIEKYTKSKPDKLKRIMLSLTPNEAELVFHVFKYSTHKSPKLNSMMKELGKRLYPDLFWYDKLEQ